MNLLKCCILLTLCSLAFSQNTSPFSDKETLGEKIEVSLRGGSVVVGHLVEPGTVKNPETGMAEEVTFIVREMEGIRIFGSRAYVDASVLLDQGILMVVSPGTYERTMIAFDLESFLQLNRTRLPVAETRSSDYLLYFDPEAPSFDREAPSFDREAPTPHLREFDMYCNQSHSTQGTTVTSPHNTGDWKAPCHGTLGDRGKCQSYPGNSQVTEVWCKTYVRWDNEEVETCRAQLTCPGYGLLDGGPQRARNVRLWTEDSGGNDIFAGEVDGKLVMQSGNTTVTLDCFN